MSVASASAHSLFLDLEAVSKDALDHPEDGISSSMAYRRKGKKSIAGSMTMRRITRAFKAPDVVDKGTLNRAQLQQFLGDLHPKRVRPTADEMHVVLQEVDQEATGAMSIEQVTTAVHLYKQIVKNRSKMKAYMRKCDTTGHGRMRRTDVMTLLSSLNEDIPVSDRVLDLIMLEADKSNKGELTEPELLLATRMFEEHLNLTNDSACGHCVIS
eukprot:NODE_12997_length_1191_cov_8.930451.p1 GENE.NODE_12997_length_1191_cov_8.930451~~NODE_12997_length_1191_cov_8.930451.p1  ORF type:complete len:213 (-),score=55.47 NODE_12997_length_1191_cov_8.930451:108-746(-)